MVPSLDNPCPRALSFLRDCQSSSTDQSRKVPRPTVSETDQDLLSICKHSPTTTFCKLFGVNHCVPFPGLWFTHRCRLCGVKVRSKPRLICHCPCQPIAMATRSHSASSHHASTGQTSLWPLRRQSHTGKSDSKHATRLGSPSKHRGCGEGDENLL